MRIPAVIAVVLLSQAVIAPRLEAAGLLESAEAIAALDDIGTRLQFDFYTADSKALQRDLASLASLEVPAELASLKHTYLGFGAWKRAELLRSTEAQVAAELAGSCTDELEHAVELEPRRAAVLAMLSRCENLVADLQSRVRAPRAASRARQNLERASALAPRDPHVLLIEGTTEYERWRLSGGDLSQRACQTAISDRCLRSFSAESTTTDSFATAMSWGAAEAWGYLGQVEVDLGNVAAARDAFEQALVIVAEYREVQERLRGITGR